MDPTGDLAVTCSSASTPCTTTVTTTNSGSIPALPPIHQQQYSSTPCLTQENLYRSNVNFEQFPQLLNQHLSNTSLFSNQRLTQDVPQQHNSNPALSANQFSGETISWQVVRSNKRKKNASETSPNLKLKLKRFEPYNSRPVISSSQYQPIAVDDDEMDDIQPSTTNNRGTNNPQSSTSQPSTSQPKPTPPPPVFIHGVLDYQKMRDNISTALQETDYITRTLANNTVKINPKTVDAYRALVQHLRSNNIVFHTYQIKQERAYRVVLRHIHHTIPTSDIKTELEGLGFKVRNIINITSRRNKSPLNLFFVDLEPAENNKRIYELKYLMNMKITVEPPRKSTNIVQCTRCQTYGHTKAYCTRPFACVKCGGDHSSSSCGKTRDLPATCALCDGPHPANYKGCTVYKDLQNMKKNNQQGQQYQSNVNRIPNQATPSAQTITTNNNADKKSRTYASMFHRDPHPQNPHPNPPSDQLSLTSFLQEFKTMFNQLINQNTMIIQMLHTVISNSAQK